MRRGAQRLRREGRMQVPVRYRHGTMTEMDPFLQDAPRFSNRFRTDRALRHPLERILPPDVFAETQADFDGMGAKAAGPLRELSARAEANPPRHVVYDGFGRRVDRIDVDPAWLDLVRFGKEAGLVAIPFEDRFGAHARVVQFGMIDLWNPAGATAGCPLSMTDAATRTLLTEDDELARRYVPRLTARDAGAWTSGQWM